MNKILVWIISKTGLIRGLAVAITGFLVGAGIVTGDDEAQVIAAMVLILTGLVSWLVEQRKATHVKDFQKINGLKADGYFGPETDAVARSGKGASNR